MKAESQCGISGVLWSHALVSRVLNINRTNDGMYVGSAVVARVLKVGKTIYMVSVTNGVCDQW